MAGKKHLIFALDAAAWGRVTLGLEIARQLVLQGDQVLFVASTTTISIIRSSPFRAEELPDHLGPLCQLCLEDLVGREAANSLLLCDFYSCERYFSLRGLNTQFLMSLNLPVLAMDIWNCAEAGLHMDLVGGQSVPRNPGIEGFTGRLVPVPISRPTTQHGYCALPPEQRVARRVRRHIRRNLGLTDQQRAVLFCTAGWQHEMNHPARRRLATLVPQLLWQYLADVRPEVRLLHLGPIPLPFDASGDRYLWMPCVSPDNFDRLLGSADLLVSVNISASTLGHALALGVPTLVLQNSIEAKTAVEAEALIGGTISQRLRAWLQEATPIYPFSVWPLGYRSFLRAVLNENPYCSAIQVAELLDESNAVGKLQQLLYDEPSRVAALGRQESYLYAVRKLRSAADSISAHIA